MLPINSVIESKHNAYYDRLYRIALKLGVNATDMDLIKVIEFEINYAKVSIK